MQAGLAAKDTWSLRWWLHAPAVVAFTDGPVYGSAEQEFFDPPFVEMFHNCDHTGGSVSWVVGDFF
jgi:hypothetical protein